MHDRGFALYYAPDNRCIAYKLCTSNSRFRAGSHTVVIEGYRHNRNLTSGDSVPLGTQIILVCWVVGLPYGAPLNYSWTCPNGPCEVEGYYGRKVYNEHILVVNTTSTSDEVTYTCWVTATGVQEVRGSFTLTVSGMCCKQTDQCIILNVRCEQVMNGILYLWHIEHI